MTMEQRRDMTNEIVEQIFALSAGLQTLEGLVLAERTHLHDLCRFSQARDALNEGNGPGRMSVGCHSPAMDDQLSR